MIAEVCRILGEVTSIVRDQAVVRIRDPLKIPSIGARAIHKLSGKVIGVVNDVIGPVSSPYAVIKLSKGASVAVGDEILYEVRRRSR
jgi:rRNA processing protein Gar1